MPMSSQPFVVKDQGQVTPVAVPHSSSITFFFPTGYIFAANGILSDNKLDQWSLTDQIEMGLSPTFASPGQRKTPSKVYSLAKTLVSSVPMHNDDHYTKLEELCSNSKRQAPLARSSGP